MKDQYLANMRFAEELMGFLQSEAPACFGFKTLWKPKLAISELDKQTDFPACYEEISWSVYYVITEKVNEIAVCYEDFLGEMHSRIDDIYETNFARRALKIAPLFFPKGYNHGAFLGYCAMVLGVACQFLVLTPNGIPQRACQVVGIVLFMHQMTGEFYEEGGWQGLYEVSLNFNKCIEDRQNKRNTKN